MKPSEVLDRAVEIIERDGWIQGTYYLEPPTHLPVPAGEYDRAVEEAWRGAPCCLQGAIIRALAGTWESFGLLSRADRDTIGQARGFCRQLTGDHPVRWNDAPGRTKGEVVEMLKEAACLAREAGE